MDKELVIASAETFQVGQLKHIGDDDPELATIAECVAWAKKDDPAEMRTYGIWTGQRFGSELVAIFHEGELFKRWG